MTQVTQETQVKQVTQVTQTPVANGLLGNRVTLVVGEVDMLPLDLDRVKKLSNLAALATD